MRRGKYEKRRAPVVNFAMGLSFVLFWLVLITTGLAVGLFARYSTQSGGGDNARVIVFGELTLTETGMDQYNQAILPGVPMNRQTEVDFTGSESATYVFIQATPATNLVEGEPLASWSFDSETATFRYGEYFSWGVTDEWTYLPESENVFYMALDPNEPLTDEPILRALTSADVDASVGLVLPGTVAVTPELTKAELERVVNVTITFTAKVVQSNGFASPEEAWASLSSKEGAA